MTTYTKQLTDVNEKALAFAAATHNSTLPAGAVLLTDLEYLDLMVSGAIKSWQDQFIKVPSSEFLLRFPAGKIDEIRSIAAGDGRLSAYIDELRVSPWVYTGSVFVRSGIAMLVTAGILTQAQADAILE